MKKIVVLNGSPHQHGCTAALIGEVIKSCEKQGAEIQYFYLHGMNINPCKGCNHCRNTGSKCVIQDDMQTVLDEMQKADAVIFGTPVYIWQMSAQLKTAVDRMLPFLTSERSSRLNIGKKVLLAAVQGVEDIMEFRNYFEYFGKSLVDIFHFDEYKILIAGGTQTPEDVLKQNEILKQAQNMGSWLSQ
jgi:multimeric flavodoxin WrbA